MRRARAAASPLIKRALSEAAALSGVYRLAGSRYGGIGVVLTMHRVARPGRPVLWPGYEIHADLLDSLLATTRQLGWEIVTLDEMHRRLSEGDGKGRFACFTLDDGYRDNLEVALSVFRKHDAPFCVYACTGMIERSVFYWWGGLEALVAQNDRIVYTRPGETETRTLIAGTWAEKCRAYDDLNDLCDGAAPEIARELLRRYDVDCDAVMDRDVMTKDEMLRLAADPLVTIGAHGVAHRRLSGMSDAEAQAEIAGGRRLLEGWLGRPVRHLAYPFGAANACGPREFDLARESGYATAVTTRRGNIFPAHRYHLTCLPRREVPIDVVRLRHALYGVDTLLRRQPRFQTV